MGDRPFGWEVDVESCEFMVYIPGDDRNTVKTFHWRGCSEATARRRGLMKPNAQAVVAVRPVSEAAWIRAYGIGRM